MTASKAALRAAWAGWPSRWTSREMHHGTLQWGWYTQEVEPVRDATGAVVACRHVVLPQEVT